MSPMTVRLASSIDREARPPEDRPDHLRRNVVEGSVRQTGALHVPGEGLGGSDAHLVTGCGARLRDRDHRSEVAVPAVVAQSTRIDPLSHRCAAVGADSAEWARTVHPETAPGRVT